MVHLTVRHQRKGLFFYRYLYLCTSVMNAFIWGVSHLSLW